MIIITVENDVSNNMNNNIDNNIPNSTADSLFAQFNRWMRIHHEKPYWIVEYGEVVYYKKPCYRIDKKGNWINRQLVRFLYHKEQFEEIPENQISNIENKYIRYLKAYHSISYESFQKQFNRFARRKGDILYINTKEKGIIELDMIKGEILSIYKHNPSLKVLSYINIDYDESADCPVFKQTLEHVLPFEYDRELFRLFMAYSLIDGCNDWHTALFLWGTGGNGKSTILDPLMELFPHRKTPKLKQISSKFAGGHIVDADIIYASESNEAIPDYSNIKDMVTGKPFSASQKYKEPVEFFPSAKIIITANDEPNFNTYSVLRRFILLRTPNRFTDDADTSREEKILKELPGVFNWIISYISEYWLNKDELMKGVAERTSTILSSFSDVHKEFIYRFIYEEQNCNTPNDVILKSMNDFLEAKGVEKINVFSLGKHLKNYFNRSLATSRPKGGSTHYINIGVNFDELHKAIREENGELERELSQYNYKDNNIDDIDNNINGKKKEISRYAMVRDKVLEIVSNNEITVGDLPNNLYSFFGSDDNNIDIEYVDKTVKKLRNDGILNVDYNGNLIAASSKYKKNDYDFVSLDEWT